MKCIQMFIRNETANINGILVPAQTENGDWKPNKTKTKRSGKKNTCGNWQLITIHNIYLAIGNFPKYI